MRVIQLKQEAFESTDDDDVSGGCNVDRYGVHQLLPIAVEQRQSKVVWRWTPPGKESPAVDGGPYAVRRIMRPPVCSGLQHRRGSPRFCLQRHRAAAAMWDRNKAAPAVAEIDFGGQEVMDADGIENEVVERRQIAHIRIWTELRAAGHKPRPPLSK
jgi:hypothetical protein